MKKKKLWFKELIQKYHSDIRGVIHIGGHYGEERFVYKELGIKNVIWFEPLKRNYEILLKNVNSKIPA